MRKAISYILSLFILLDTILLIGSGVFLLTFGSKSYYLSQFEKSPYINACSKSIANGIADLSLASGIPEKAVAGAVVKKDVTSAVKEMIGNYFNYIDGKTSSVSMTVNTSAFTSRLNESINSYVKKSGMSLSDDTKQAVKNYIKKCDTVFSSNLMQITYFDKVSAYLGKMLRLCRIAVALSAFALVVLIVIALAAGNGEFLSRLLYPIYGLSCAGALVAVPSAVALISGLPYHLSLLEAAERELAGNLISGFFVYSLIIGLAVLAAGIISTFIIQRIIKAQRF